jgi:hypothetical protein
MGAGTLGSDLAGHAPLAQDLPTRLVVIAGVQMRGGPLGQRAQQPDGVQGGGQQPVVAVVGQGRHRDQRDPARLGGDRAFQPLLAAVHRTGPGSLAAAGRLGDAAIHGQVLQFQAEQPVIGGQHRMAQLLGHPALIHSSRRRRRVVAEQLASAMRR